MPFCLIYLSMISTTTINSLYAHNTLRSTKQEDRLLVFLDGLHWVPELHSMALSLNWYTDWSAISLLYVTLILYYISVHTLIPQVLTSLWDFRLHFSNTDYYRRIKQNGWESLIPSSTFLTPEEHTIESRILFDLFPFHIVFDKLVTLPQLYCLYYCNYIIIAFCLLCCVTLIV